MGDAVDVLMDAVRVRKERDLARTQSINTNIQGIGQNIRGFRELAQKDRQLAQTDRELDIKESNIPDNLLKSQGAKADALLKLLEAGAINQQQYQAAVGNIAQQTLSSNLVSSLTQNPNTAPSSFVQSTPSSASAPQTQQNDLFATKVNAAGVATELKSASGIKRENELEAEKQIKLATEKKKQDLNVKRADLKKDLTSILAFESTIPRSEEGGLDRFIQGGKNALSAFLENSDIGQNISTYQDLIDQITPKVARASGDVANIAVAERQFAKKAFPGISETKGKAANKRAFLIEFTKAIDSDSPSEVKKILNDQGVPYFDLEENKWVNLKVGNKEVTKEEIEFAMEKYNLTEEEVLERLNA